MSGGNSFPLGILAPSTRNSSKKGWIIASTALNRAPGVYSNSFATKSIASEAVRGRKTYNKQIISKRKQRNAESVPTLEKGWGLI